MLSRYVTVTISITSTISRSVLVLPLVFLALVSHVTVTISITGINNGFNLVLVLVFIDLLHLVIVTISITSTNNGFDLVLVLAFLALVSHVHVVVFLFYTLSTIVIIRHRWLGSSLFNYVEVNILYRFIHQVQTLLIRLHFLGYVASIIDT